MDFELKLSIDNPKSKSVARNDKDLSDHYPIIIETTGLKIVSYNLQLMPTLISKAEGKKNKAEITEAISEFTSYFEYLEADICCVQELFSNTANAIMEREMLKKGYVATDRVGKEGLAIFNGGARTFIRAELKQQKLETYEHIYQNKIDYFVGADALANKGLVQVCYENPGEGNKTHVINTHLQAFYRGREHYAEVALAQCVELKKFIEAQKAKGIIGPNDKIVVCGDFNIPIDGNSEEAQFLFEKMKRILGPQFTFPPYTIKQGGPTHTISSDNSYNTGSKGASDMDISVDLAIVFDPQVKKDSSLIDTELSDIYCGIQLAISHFVRSNATLLSTWLLSPAKTNELAMFNQRFKALMQRADQIRASNANPIDDPVWLAEAIILSSGPSHQNPVKPTSAQDIELQEITELPVEDLSSADIEQCRAKFDSLIHNIKQLHAEIHKSYIESGVGYKKAFETSLKLQHALLNAGNQFFNNPTAVTFYKFKKICEHELISAKKEFENNASIWAKMSPIFKGIIGLLAAISVLPALFISAKTSEGFKKTFFAPAPVKVINQIKEDFDTAHVTKLQKDKLNSMKNQGNEGEEHTLKLPDKF